MPPHSLAPTTSTPAEFAESVGRAILAWQDVELRCAHFYVALLDARNSQGALASFHAVHSLNVRAMMLKTAAHHMFRSPDFEDLSEDFEALMRNLGECSRFRNRLTHSEVAEELTGGGFAYSLKTPDIEMLSPVAGRQGKGSPPQPLDFAAITRAEGQFQALALGLKNLEGQVRDRLDHF